MVGIGENRKHLVRTYTLLGYDQSIGVCEVRLISCISGKELKYLDDRPVFPKERACAEAWERGGTEAENEERQNWINKERRRVQQSVEFVNNIRKNAEAKRQASLDSEENHEKEPKVEAGEVSTYLELF